MHFLFFLTGHRPGCPALRSLDTMDKMCFPCVPDGPTINVVFNYVLFILQCFDLTHESGRFLLSPLCIYRNTRVISSCIFVMNRVGPSWDPMDPNVLSVIDPNSDLGRDLAISLQAAAEEEEEENNTGRLTDE